MQEQPVVPLQAGDATARIRDTHRITVSSLVVERSPGAICQGCAHKPVRIVPRTVDRASSGKVRVRQSPSLVITV